MLLVFEQLFQFHLFKSEKCVFKLILVFFLKWFQDQDHAPDHAPDHDQDHDQDHAHNLVEKVSTASLFTYEPAYLRIIRVICHFPDYCLEKPRFWVPWRLSCTPVLYLLLKNTIRVDKKAINITVSHLARLKVCNRGPINNLS